jgi:hypothetical protein
MSFLSDFQDKQKVKPSSFKTLKSALGISDDENSPYMPMAQKFAGTNKAVNQSVTPAKDTSSTTMNVKKPVDTGTPRRSVDLDNMMQIRGMSNYANKKYGINASDNDYTWDDANKKLMYRNMVVPDKLLLCIITLLVVLNIFPMVYRESP